MKTSLLSGVAYLVIGWLSASAAFAQSPATAPVPTENARAAGVFTLYFENDYFGGTDRHYTNGVKFSWITSDLGQWAQDGWRRRLVERLPFYEREGAQKNFGFAFGQNIFTPQDTDAAIPNPLDRPYAGWSYLEFSFISKTENIADTFALQLGMVGRHSYAQDTQRIIHEWINSSRPNGWEYQLRDEVGVNAVWERRWRFYGRALSERLGIDFVPHAGVSLGNVQTYVNTGGMVRLGINLPSDFGVQLIRSGGDGTSPINDRDPRVSREHPVSFFVFASGDGRAVAQDIFLDGNTFRDGPSVDKKHFVADLSYGVGLIKGAFQLTFTQVYRTQEFETQLNDHNEFGSLTLSWAF